MVQPVLRFVFFTAIALLWSCGAIQYTKQMEVTEQAFTQAREQRVHEYAPYEYFYAKAYLNQARAEAARSSYENAIRYAKTAEKYCSIAFETARRRREEKGDTGAIQ